MYNKTSLAQSPASIVINHLRDYPTPSNLNFFFSWGSLAGVCLMIQILTGIFLVMHYSPTTMELSFQSVSHIMREVNQGWLIRYIHANGASIFFMVLYLHIAKGLYYKSYVYEFRFTWIVGCVIFLLTMAAAFLGYCLVAGQMSFWGATVITNLISAVPVVGVHLVYWIWGGFSVNNATITRFFSLHYVIPFIILLMVMIHLYFLHQVGSSNPTKLDTHQLYTDLIFFYPYFFLKDLLGLVGLFLVFTLLVCWAPNLLGHSDNYIEANPLVTPAHIVPEWYFWKRFWLYRVLVFP